MFNFLPLERYGLLSDTNEPGTCLSSLQTQKHVEKPNISKSWTIFYT